MRRHKHRNRRRSKQGKIIIITSICLLFIMTAGYAAFSTNLKLRAATNIKCNPISIEKLKESKVTTGSGLYENTYGYYESSFFYKGINPNNYILFNDEMWRIINIQPDNAIKIVKNEPLNSPLNFDYSNTRFTNNNYCSSVNSQGNNGCNLFGSTKETISGGNIMTMMPYRTDDLTKKISGPSSISYLNKYLNNEYYSSLSSKEKKYIISYNYDYGLLPTMYQSSSYDISNLLYLTRRFYGTYFVAIPKLTDYVLASTYTGCGSDSYYVSEECTKAAAKENWMYDNFHNFWLINPLEYKVGNSYYTYKNAAVSSKTGGIIQVNSYQNNPNVYVKPVLFLTSEIKLCGKGTKEAPYMIWN